MRVTSSVALATCVSNTRMPGFEKATLALGAKFLPEILTLTCAPRAACDGSTAATSGVPSSEGWISAAGAAGVGAAGAVAAPAMVKAASATALAGLLT